MLCRYLDPYIIGEPREIFEYGFMRNKLHVKQTNAVYKYRAFMTLYFKKENKLQPKTREVKTRKYIGVKFNKSKVPIQTTKHLIAHPRM